MVDFDSARHNVLSLEHAKKRDETKIAKAQEELREAKKIYEDLNNDLHEELPDLYESRVSFISSNFNTLFNTEVTFLEESAKLKSKMSDVASQLSQENSKGTYHVNRSNSTHSRDHPKENNSTSEHKRVSEQNSTDRKSLSTFYNVSLPNDYESDKHSDKQSEPEQRPVSRTSGASEDAQASVASSNEAKDESPLPQTNGNVSSSEDLATTSATPPVPSARVSSATTTTTTTTVTTTEQTEEPKAPIDEPQYEPISVGAQQLEDGDNLTGETCDTDVPADKTLDTSVYALASEGPEEELYRVPLSNEPIHKLPEGVLYQVQATHPYAGEDTDELTFDSGEIIDVIPFDDPDEQDEGWLMGTKKDGDRGVFPFNFTKRI